MSPNRSSRSQYVDVAHAASYHGVQPDTIRTWIKKGHLPAYRIGPPTDTGGIDHRQIRIRIEDLDAPYHPITTAA